MVDRQLVSYEQTLRVVTHLSALACQRSEMPVDSKTTPAILQQVMQADRYRLLQAWRRLNRKENAGTDLAKWQSRAEASAERKRIREGLVPVTEYDPDLPISEHREEIIGLLRDHQVIVVCGETGSGKSTQLPKICLEAGYGRTGMIGHTQPRRLAARAVASRLADELKTSVGELVGFKIRFSDSTGNKTLVKLMTDGILLAETQTDRFLDQYDVIIIDEAHERSLNIDFLLGYLKRIAVKRPDLRIIITSATIDPERFAKHFEDDRGPAPVVEVSGRTYPVEVRYQGILEDDPDDQELSRAIAEAADELMLEGSGDILTFLPTERDIRVTAKYLRGHFTNQGNGERVEVLPLYARLSQAEQNRIFAAHSKRRIILSTNVAESSLTVPGIHFVIDTGLVRISRYAPKSKVQRLPIEAISQASANQRSGRCGRLGPGVCIRLFSEEDFQKRPKYTTPEIRRSDLASVLLQSHVLKLGSLTEFPLMDPPGAESIRDGERTLLELNAIDSTGKLTKIGRQLGALPCDPRVGRMLLEASERGCAPEVLVIAAAIECQDVRQRPAGYRDQADEAHQKFQDPHSDFLSLIRLWDFFEKLKSDLGRSRLKKALEKNFLSHQGFREWADVVRQLRELMLAAKIKVGKRKLNLEAVDPIVFERSKDQKGNRGRQQNSEQEKAIAKLKRPSHYAAIHQSLLTGMLSGVAQRGDRHEYKAVRNLSVVLWPGSGLFKRQPKWIMAGEIVETTRRYVRNVAEIDVEWVEQAAGDLLKHNYSDPHWSRKSGAPMVYRRSTLYGLSVIVGRRVALAPIDPDGARTLLIEHGLVAGEWNCREAFYVQNQELLADLHELAQRTRSREFILDRFHLGNFYADRLPLEIVDLHSLKNWCKRNKNSAELTRLIMKPEDLIQHDEVLTRVGDDFPNEIKVGDSSFPVEYHFEPGHHADGLTITVPQAALRQISQEALGWLVPGLLEEKVLHLIRSLPKSKRTNFVPAPDVAKQLAELLTGADKNQPFSSVLCDLMSSHAGERIRPSDFDFEKLPPHLQVLVNVVDDEGAPIEADRNVERLKQEYAIEDSNLGGEQVAEDSWTNQKVTFESFERLQETVSVRRGGVLVAAYPALADRGDFVEQSLVDTQWEAKRVSLRGWTRLLAQKNNRSLRSQVAHLPNIDQAAMKLSHLLSPQGLRSQLQDLIVRAALIEDQPLLRDRLDLEARNTGASGKISIAAQEVAVWLPKLSDEIHQVRLKQEKAPNTWREVFDDIQQQLQLLFPENFLQEIPWHHLAEYPRYLKAIQMRIEKLTGGGLPKDRKIRAPIDEACACYYSTLETCISEDQQEKCEQLRWLIEEFRVSVFAQTLGTKEKVSEKRIREFIAKLS